MKCPPEIHSEPERLKALAEYGLNTDRPLPSLDPVVSIAARMFGVPVAAVNLIGSEQVFFAASYGLSIDDVDAARDVSFCAHAITQDEVLVVPDARLDDRFFDNPLVTGASQVRFYAGVSLRSPEGHALGALCVIDKRPRPDFSADDCLRLLELARMAADRLELRRIEISTEQSRRPFEEFAKNSPTAVVWFDGTGRVVAWNSAAAALYGYGVGEGRGRSVETLVRESDRPTVRSLIDAAVSAGSVDGMLMPEGLVGLRSDGSEFLLGLSLFCWRERGQLTFNAHLYDRTARQQRQNELKRLASTDMLTGLANRAHLYRRMEEVLVASAAAGLLMLDLDGFKDVNDTLGHEVGDSVLREVALRLEAMVGADDLVSRIGGDEFAVLMPGTTETEDAVALARRLVGRISEPILVDGHEVRVAASCGIALAPIHAQEPLTLVGNADLALFKAKKVGRGEVFVFVTALRMEAVARRLYNIELHRAVSQGELVLYYQAQIGLATGSLTGAEALLRWRHPQRGLLSPAAFLPALEGGPLAAVVGAWVLDEACSQAARWRRAGAGQAFRVGVNLFGAQFRVDDIVAEVAAALHRHGLPADALELEVTENIVLEHDSHALDALKRLRAMGVGIAFDDFGTGYASLSFLKEYPLTRIKIDRSFVQSMLESERDRSVIRAILDMARSFGLETIAEGVETPEQQRSLLRIGCHDGQGYLFGRPVPEDEFAQAFGFAPITSQQRALRTRAAAR